MLVVYYSLEGHTKSLAEAIARETGAELLRIEPKEDIPTTGFGRYLKGGSQIFRKVQPELLPVAANPADYDLLFIGSPVWAGNYVPALRTLFDLWQLQDKKIALFTSHRGGKGSALASLAYSLSGNEILDQKDFFERADDFPASAGKWAAEIVARL